MSNVKNSYNGIRRIRKGCKERLILFVLMRPLRNVAIATTDEYIIANHYILLFIFLKYSAIFNDQEINILALINLKLSTTVP